MSIKGIWKDSFETYDSVLCEDPLEIFMRFSEKAQTHQDYPPHARLYLLIHWLDKSDIVGTVLMQLLKGIGFITHDLFLAKWAAHGFANFS